MSNRVPVKTVSSGAMALRERIQARADLVREGVADVRSNLRRDSLCAVLDSSGSMAENAKMDEAKSGLLDLATKCADGGFAVGLVQFGSMARLALPVQPMSLALRSALSEIHADGGTDMAAGIDLAANTLPRGGGRRVMLVVSDGLPDSADAALAAASRAKAAGIEIWTIGTSDADRDLLDRIASRKAASAFVPVAELRVAISRTADRLLLSHKP